MKKLVLFSGQHSSGKTTAANYLVKKLRERGGKQWQVAGFATGVKKIFMETFNVDADFVEKWKRIPYPPPGFLKPVRDSLIFIGDGFRQIQENVWINQALTG